MSKRIQKRLVSSTFTGCVPFSAFASVVDIPVGVTSSAGR